MKLRTHMIRTNTGLTFSQVDPRYVDALSHDVSAAHALMQVIDGYPLTDRATIYREAERIMDEWGFAE